jgi:hypothetical protein
MDNAFLVADTGQVTGSRSRLRISSVLVALALVFATLVLVQHRADAAPAAAAVTSVAAAVALPSASSPAQIDVAALIRSIVCPILNSLNAAFANFFGGFILPIIRQLQIAFGCISVSGA